MRCAWRLQTCEDAGLVLLELRPFQVRLPASFLDVRSHAVLLLRGRQLLQQWVLWRHHHVGGPKQCVGPGGEDLQQVCIPCSTCSPRASAKGDLSSLYDHLTKSIMFLDLNVAVFCTVHSVK